MTDNSLVSQTAEQKDPYKAKASDFKSVGTPDSEAGGKNTLAPTVGCARYCEDGGAGDSGAGTPVPGDRGAKVAASFKVSKQAGARGTAPDSVDLKSGMADFSQYPHPLD